MLPVLISALVACSGRSADRRPDVLLVVVDTLRQDRVGAYGYARDTTPALDALAARGVRYSEARSTGGWTAPAHASLFTGLLPAAHGTTQERWSLEGHHETLAELLGASGYATVGVTGNPMLAEKRGFSQGFEVYEESWRARGRGTRDGHTVAWLEDRFAERPAGPRFVFVNLIGVHSPYDSCGASCGAFGATPTVGGSADNGWQDHYLGRARRTPEELARLSDLYDAEVREADRMLDALVGAFVAGTKGRDHLIVVTSDHGENLGDHGHVDHVFSLYESTVRVPLVVAGTGIAADTVDGSPVQLHDVFASVVRAAGVTRPVQGLPLDEVPDDRPVVLEYYHPVQATRILEKRAANADERANLARYQHRLMAYGEGPWKVIASAAGTRELYDLGGDPGERQDLAASEPARLDALHGRGRSALAGLTLDHGSGATPAADDETQAALEALGYQE